MKGIIMSGDHPAKILAGTKTMTRRTAGLNDVNAAPDKWEVYYIVDHDRKFWRFVDRTEKSNDRLMLDIKCPYGQVGDRLWVRETWKLHTYAGSPGHEQIMLEYKAGGLTGWFKLNEVEPKPPFKFQKWVPSIHMPRWASRITLEITEVRVERVQEITEEDCYKEGLDLSIGMMLVEPHWMTKDILKRKYRDLWDSLNTKRGWESNPWVWVISFKEMK